MATYAELGEFLRSRRARLRPEDAGLPTYGGRRVPGLRRELAGHLDVDAPDQLAERPNIARMLFLDPHMRELYPEWTRKARSTVADLRLIAGRHPGAPELNKLIGELTPWKPRVRETLGGPRGG